MSNITGTFRGKATIEASSVVTITNLSVPAANTEVSHALQAGVKQIYIQNRGDARTRFAFVSGESGTKFVTLFPGVAWHVSDILLTGATLYIQCNKVSQIVEIMEWS